MKFYHTIRFRIVAGILLFGTLLIILNSGIMFVVMGKSMSKMITNLIDTEMATFLYKYEKDHTTPLPHSRYINMYTGIEKVPGHFREIVKDLPPGVHAISPAKNRPHPVHVGVIELPGNPVPHYMIFHGRSFFEENAMFNPMQILVISLGFLLIPGIIIGWITSILLYKPVVGLMEQIRGLNPENIPDRLSHSHATNEIGVLTRTIEETMNRINAFIQREKQFTRDASHELRTPLTVVKGAAEIMEQQPEIEVNPLLRKPLLRISRAVKNMETTIETFLWLAREENEPKEDCPVAPVVEKAVADSQYLVEKKDVVLETEILGTPSVQAREEVVYITLTNLIRNAVHFTAHGSIRITLKESELEIRDTGIGIEAEKLNTITCAHFKGEQSKGFGLGLNIVDRLCSRFGWGLTIDSRPKVGTRVKILWQGF